jgi:hypothetical protein
LTGVVDVPVTPVLEGFEAAAGRGRGLAAARRISSASGARVLSVRQVTPTDFRLVLRSSEHDRRTVIHVRPQRTLAELAWCAAYARDGGAPHWADLRWADRMVVGSSG